MEAQLITLLGVLINPGEEWLMESLTEGFNIAKSLEMIKKISYVRIEVDDELNAIVETAERIEMTIFMEFGKSSLIQPEYLTNK